MNNKLKVLRAMRNWSQADLADHLDVSRQTVNALETGKYDPSLPLAFKIARLFQMPIEEIFEEDRSQKAKQQNPGVIGCGHVGGEACGLIPLRSMVPLRGRHL